MMYAPDYMRSLNDKQLDACADLMEKYIAEKQNKPKRTISLEAYIKMQIKYLNFSGSELPVSADLSHAKNVVDMILKHNNVEVEEDKQ